MSNTSSLSPNKCTELFTIINIQILKLKQFTQKYHLPTLLTQNKTLLE